MATPEEWGRGFARQASADLDGWDRLRRSALPSCECLHALQMACEKLAKAHLCASGSDPRIIRSSHAYAAKQLPIIVRHQLDIENARPGLTRDIIKYTKGLAREIELLAPSVDDDSRRPENCEYPWEDGTGRLCIPADFVFAVESILEERHGRTVLKLVRAAVNRMAG